METIAKVFSKREFICPASPVKSEQIAHLLWMIYPLLCHAAVPLKSELFHRMAQGDLTFSLVPGYSSLWLFHFFFFFFPREKMFPLYFCFLHLEQKKDALKADAQLVCVCVCVCRLIQYVNVGVFFNRSTEIFILSQ